MTVKRKLLYGFMSITLMVIILGKVSFYLLDDIDTNMQTLVKETIPKKRIVSDSIFLMEKSISEFLIFASAYDKKNTSVMVDKNLDVLINKIKYLQKESNSKDKKELNSTIKDIQKFKSVVDEYSVVHNQKLDLYFNFEDKLYNVESFFYYENYTASKWNFKLQESLRTNESFSLNKKIEDSLFYKWYNTSTIKNKRISKFITRYNKTNEEIFALLKETQTSQDKTSFLQKAIELNNKRDKTALKIIRLSSKTSKVVEASEKENFDILMGVGGNISTKLGQIEKTLDKKITKTQLTISETISTESTVIITSIFIIVVLGIVIATVVSRNISNSIKHFQTGLLSFFDFINKKTQDVELIKIKSNDEFGQMGILLNEHIEETKKSIVQNRQFVDELVQVVNEVNEGHLDQRINIDIDDEILSTFKTNFNKMLGSLDSSIQIVLDFFEEFKKNQFTKQCDIEYSGHIKDLLQGVNSLGQEFSNMLGQNLKNGFTLESNLEVLSQQINNLTKASTTQASAIEKTVLSVENITENIRSNRQNTIKMEGFANKVKTSAIEGEQLANRTVTSMEEISVHVTTINEAISIIDSIAFQTNIL
ncbi:MAG: methyl-accepting chemotaxis protein, partial [Campylobacteraceae bacterium]|nr:methyl-accepting chemotaxis protein [Campylobacteraceae bacterium]